MKFSEAMKLLEEGKKVRRVDWEKDTYIYSDDDCLLVNNTNKGLKIETDGEWEELRREEDGKTLL